MESDATGRRAAPQASFPGFTQGQAAGEALNGVDAKGDAQPIPQAARDAQYRPSPFGEAGNAVPQSIANG